MKLAVTSNLINEIIQGHIQGGCNGALIFWKLDKKGKLAKKGYFSSIFLAFSLPEKG